MGCGVGRRCGLDPALLWFCRRLVATALIGPQAWEPPYTTGAALEKTDKKRKEKKKSILYHNPAPIPKELKTFVCMIPEHVLG